MTLIFSEKDPWGTVEVFESATLRTLHFGNAVIQSSMFLLEPFRLEMEYNRTMMLALLFNPSPQRALFLGLGGASQPKFLWKHFPLCQCDIVERSPLVIETAHRFFHTPQDKRFQVKCLDAYEFLRKAAPEQSYDFIFVDLFFSDRMADTLERKDFFNDCRKILKDSGLLVWNLWQSTSQEIKEVTLTNLVQAFGPRMLILPNFESPNAIVIAFSKEDLRRPSTSDLQRAAQSLLLQTGMDFPSTLETYSDFKNLFSTQQ